MTTKSCSSCLRPLKGHTQPWGSNCQLEPLVATTTATLTTVTATVSVCGTVSSAATTGTTTSATTLPPPPSAADEAALLEERLADVAAQNDRIRSALHEAERLKELRASVREQEDLLASLTAQLARAAPPENTATPPVPTTTCTRREPIPPAPIQGVPTLQQLRDLHTLDQQAQAVIYGTDTASAIARADTTAANTPHDPARVHVPAPRASDATTSWPAPVSASDLPPHPTPAGKRDTGLLWPNEYVHRAGQPDIQFHALTIQELVVGTSRLLLKGTLSPQEQRGRLAQIVDVMILSQQYRWDRVRALLHEALSQLSRGQRSWDQPIADLVPEMLKSWDVIQRPPTTSATTATTAPICHQFNTARDGCPRGAQCPYRHICKECQTQRGQANPHPSRTCSHNRRARSPVTVPRE